MKIKHVLIVAFGLLLIFSCEDKTGEIGPDGEDNEFAIFKNDNQTAYISEWKSIEWAVDTTGRELRLYPKTPINFSLLDENALNKALIKYYWKGNLVEYKDGEFLLSENISQNSFNFTLLYDKNIHISSLFPPYITVLGNVESTSLTKVNINSITPLTLSRTLGFPLSKTSYFYSFFYEQNEDYWNKALENLKMRVLIIYDNNNLRKQALDYNNYEEVKEHFNIKD